MNENDQEQSPTTSTLEPWQAEELQALLALPTHQVEEGLRIYTSSRTYGTSRYHLIEKRYDGVQIEQIDSEEKWSKRLNLHEDELPAVLAALLRWHLDAVKPAYVTNPTPDESEEEEHPF